MFWVSQNQRGVGWSIWGSHRPTTQSVQILLDGILSFLVCWVYHTAWCCQQTCRGCSWFHFMSPRRVFNSSGTSAYPYRTLLIIGLHLDIKLLTTTLWMWPSSQSLFPLEVHPSNPCLQFRAKEVLWDSVMLCASPSRWHQLLFSYPPLL